MPEDFEFINVSRNKTAKNTLANINTARVNYSNLNRYIAFNADGNIS